MTTKTPTTTKPGRKLKEQGASVWGMSGYKLALVWQLSEVSFIGAVHSVSLGFDSTWPGKLYERIAYRRDIWENYELFDNRIWTENKLLAYSKLFSSDKFEETSAEWKQGNRKMMSAYKKLKEIQ